MNPRLIAFILFSPFVWWVGAVFAYTIANEETKHRGSASIVGLFILLLFWGCYFL